MRNSYVLKAVHYLDLISALKIVYAMCGDAMCDDAMCDDSMCDDAMCDDAIYVW